MNAGRVSASFSPADLEKTPNRPPDRCRADIDVPPEHAVTADEGDMLAFDRDEDKDKKAEEKWEELGLEEFVAESKESEP